MSAPLFITPHDTIRSSPCLVLLPVGFALPVLSPEPRCALTAPFHPYRTDPLRSLRGGLFSVALSRPLRVVGVTHHRVLWSPDFPPCRLPRTAIAQPTPNVAKVSYGLDGQGARGNRSIPFSRDAKSSQRSAGEQNTSSPPTPAQNCGTLIACKICSCHRRVLCWEVLFGGNWLDLVHSRTKSST